MNQQSFFDQKCSKKPAITNTLVIMKQAKKTVSKSQQMFNRLTKKIETLQTKIREKAKVLDTCLDFYVRFLYPIEQEMTALRKEIVKLLYPFYSNKNILRKNERKILKEMIVAQLGHICSNDTEVCDDEIKHIFEAMHGQKYDEALAEGIKEEFKEMKDTVESMFAMEGMDIDLNGIDMETDQETFFHKLREQMEKMSQKKGAEETTKRETKKQTKMKMREMEIKEASKRNLNSIYRQLAKVLHPDLEQDAVIRVEKEALMRQLTAAYAANDLHTLLRLEMQWINQENTHLETLSEEKLSIYNHLLREQVQDLEQEQSLLMQNPKYFPLEQFSDPFSPVDIKRLEMARVEMEGTRCSIESSVSNLKCHDPLTEIRDILNVFNGIFNSPNP